MRETSTEDVSPRPPATAPTSHTRTLIDDYLAEQQRLQTPARRFADAQERHAVRDPIWRDSIPLTTPAAGEQYAFEVDVDRCTGCKACVAGCHSLNGLDDEETWRDVGLVLGGTRSQPFQQTITTACHHCADPACLNGCPVLAYEKDPVTGIVRHLDDQCIGCQYCVLKCPYDVPKYSERLGIVRKCDMCHSRLSAGEAPACVQACPTQAIRIVTVKIEIAPGRRSVDTEQFLRVAPPPDYTQPTTRYISRRAWPENTEAADAAELRPQPPHWPLIVMLTLMPMAVGGTVLAAQRPSSIELLHASAVVGTLGLVASVLHLGQPLRAWKIFLGLRTSWLSREAMVFSLWLAAIVAACVSSLLSRSLLLAGSDAPGPFTIAATACAAIFGLLGLACSALIYIDTRRPFWRFSQTVPRFFGAALVLGLGLGNLLYPHSSYAWAIALGVLVKLGAESRCFRVLDSDDETPTPERQTALLLAGPLRHLTALRYVSGFALAVLAFASLKVSPSLALRSALFALALLGETTERFLFFRAVYAPKMPGVAAR